MLPPVLRSRGIRAGKSSQMSKHGMDKAAQKGKVYIDADRIRNLFPETKELIDANIRQDEFWRSGHSRNTSTLYPTR